MTQTIISLISIFVGILGAVLLGVLKPKFSLGITANIIVGVFTSIFIIKSFGRLGFSPNHIITQQQINYVLLIINLISSFLAGILGLVFAFNIKKKLLNIS